LTLLVKKPSLIDGGLTKPIFRAERLGDLLPPDTQKETD
jgi:hypothetical protein